MNKQEYRPKNTTSCHLELWLRSENVSCIGEDHLNHWFLGFVADMDLIFADNNFFLILVVANQKQKIIYFEFVLNKNRVKTELSIFRHLFQNNTEIVWLIAHLSIV